MKQKKMQKDLFIRKDTYLQKKEQIIDELRLIPEKVVYFQKLLMNLMLTLERYIYPKEGQQIIDELRLV